MIKQKVLTLLVLLMTAVTGARAAWTGGTYTATANENLNAITVSDDATLTINADVTVTVTGGITVASGKTLTITGGGTLVANGANGQTGNAGGTAIAGNVIINGVGLTVTATGGQGGQGGQGDEGDQGADGSNGYDGGQGGKGGKGANGGSAFSGAVTIYAGSVRATGGQGGQGGKGGQGGNGGEGDEGGKGGNGGKGGDGGDGGQGGYAFAGTLTVYGGNVNATGGQGGRYGDGGDGGDGGGSEGGHSGGPGGPGDQGENGAYGYAYANSVTFEAATYTVKNNFGDPINLNNITSELNVIIQSADAELVVTYSVALADGTEDAANWQGKAGEGEYQALPLEGVAADTAVSVKYNGTKKVIGVKAEKKAAAPSVPDGAINGKFSVSDSKQVYFSKGNLRYASGAWSFFDNQYDYYTSYSADAWDKFGWSTSAPTYGMNDSTDESDYSGDFVDWGATMGTGWFTLSSDEWTYLFNNRSASTVGGTENGRYAKAKVNDVQGVILFPDTYTHPDGVTAPTGVNATGNTGWNGNNYSSADWTKMESAGCVFLPAAGRRYSALVEVPGTTGYYLSATPRGTDEAYNLYFNSDNLKPADSNSLYLGCSVRLVRQVTE